LTAVVIPAYLTLREHEVLLILRSVVKMSGDVVSCLLSEFHWPKSGVIVQWRLRGLTRQKNGDSAEGFSRRRTTLARGGASGFQSPPA
jgi:hypothetical protein